MSMQVSMDIWQPSFIHMNTPVSKNLVTNGEMQIMLELGDRGSQGAIQPVKESGIGVRGVKPVQDSILQALR